MNFYKHHIGDYAKDTQHLSWDEDQAYTRLLRIYYRDEKPLPLDLEKVARLVMAKTAAQRAAVEVVLKEFFLKFEGGWRNKRADEEIITSKEIFEDAHERRENEKERQKRHRAERKQLFAALRDFDVVLPYDTSTETLRARLIKLKDVTDQSRVTGGVRPQPVTRTSTAVQYPVPSTQYPEPSTQIPILRVQENAYEGEPPENAHTNFEAIKASYPRFTGRQNWIEAEHFCHQRIERDGATWPDLIAATQRYATYCQNGGVSGQQFVLTPAKFFSAADKPWAQAWDPPPTKSDIRLSTNIDAATEFMRRTEQVS